MFNKQGFENGSGLNPTSSNSSKKLEKDLTILDTIKQYQSNIGLPIKYGYDEESNIYWIKLISEIPKEKMDDFKIISGEFIVLMNKLFPFTNVAIVEKNNPHDKILGKDFKFIVPE